MHQAAMVASSRLRCSCMQVSIPAPDPALPPSFDSDTTGHHYRFLESATQARLIACHDSFAQPLTCVA